MLANIRQKSVTNVGKHSSDICIECWPTLPYGTEDMVQKIQAAIDARTDDDFTIIVRTDSIAVTGWDDAMNRCDAYVNAGADALFIEALRTPEEVERAGKNLGVPLLFNFVESGKSPLLSASELERFGFKIVIYPASALLSVAHVVEQVMAQLREKGTTSHLLELSLIHISEPTRPY